MTGFGGVEEQVSWPSTPSPPEYLTQVPLQRPRVGAVLHLRGQRNRPSIERVVASAIREVGAQLAAYHEAEIRRHADVATIEQSMDVAAQEQPIHDLVLSAVAIRTDVRRFEGRQ